MPTFCEKIDLNYVEQKVAFPDIGEILSALKTYSNNWVSKASTDVEKAMANILLVPYNKNIMSCIKTYDSAPASDKTGKAVIIAKHLLNGNDSTSVIALHNQITKWDAKVFEGAINELDQLEEKHFATLEKNKGTVSAKKLQIAYRKYTISEKLDYLSNSLDDDVKKGIEKLRKKIQEEHTQRFNGKPRYTAKYNVFENNLALYAKNIRAILYNYNELPWLTLQTDLQKIAKQELKKSLKDKAKIKVYHALKARDKQKIIKKRLIELINNFEKRRKKLESQNKNQVQIALAPGGGYSIDLKELPSINSTIHKNADASVIKGLCDEVLNVYEGYLNKIKNRNKAEKTLEIPVDKTDEKTGKAIKVMEKKLKVTDADEKALDIYEKKTRQDLEILKKNLEVQTKFLVDA